MCVSISDKALKCPLQQEKKTLKCRAWGQESAHISVIARVRNSGSLFQSFLYAFCRELALVRISGCP